MGIYIIDAADGCDLYEASPDAQLDGGVASWGITNQAHLVGMISKANESDALMRFDFTEIDGGETITSAYLQRYVTGVIFSEGEEPENMVFPIARCLRAWVTDEATFNIYSTGNNWNTAGCHGSGTDYTTTNRISPAGPAVSDLYTYFATDVTAMTADAHADDQILNIVVHGDMTLIEETDNSYWTFASYVTPLPPKLIICTNGSIQPSNFCDKVDGDGENDAHENEGSGTMNLSANQVYISSSAVEANRNWGGFRFHVGSFPSNGSTIRQAIFVINPTTNVDVNVDIYAEDAAGGAVFTSDAGNITDRTLTTASVSWAEALTDNKWSAPGDVKTILQELVDDYTLTTTVLVLDPKHDLTKSLSADAVDLGAAYSAILVAFWDEPAAVTFVPQVMIF